METKMGSVYEYFRSVTFFVIKQNIGRLCNPGHRMWQHNYRMKSVNAVVAKCCSKTGADVDTDEST
jgi:hypothetical protein